MFIIFWRERRLVVVTAPMRLSEDSEKSERPIPPSDVQAQYLPYDVLQGEHVESEESEEPCPEDTLGLVRHISPVSELPLRCRLT